MFFKKKNQEEIAENLQNENIAADEAEEKRPDGLVDGQEYDMDPVINKNEEMEKLVKDKEGIEVDYSFNGDDIREGLKVFQQNTLYKKNLIFTLILTIIFILYSVNLIMNPGETISIILCVMCVIVICFLWYSPIRHISATAKAIDANPMDFNMIIYDNCVRIKEENGSFFISYNKEITKLLETENLFLVCVGRERMFILPKRYLNENEAAVRDIFKNAMKDNYKDCKAKSKKA